MNNGPHGLSRRMPPSIDSDFIAIQALTFISSNAEHAGRFLALSGIAVDDLRRAAADPGFLLGVMDYLVGDESLLLGFAADAGIPAEAIVQAHAGMTRR